MRTAEYDFILPEDLIAKRPAEKRDDARLLVLRRDAEAEHCSFSDLPSLLDPGDLLILNNTRVFPARLTGLKPEGSPLEILLVSENPDRTWNIMTKGRYTGTVTLAGGLSAEIRGGKTASFGRPVSEVIWEIGNMPLPPYIKRAPDRADRERYQTVYAEVEGSIAAPTAGLHFTHDLLERLRAGGIKVRPVTLHVGAGTFRPVKAQEVRDHVMDQEYFEFSPGLIEEIRLCRAAGNRVIAVGTTTTRTLEGYASGDCSIISSNGRITGTTRIFIREGYRFQLIDSLITNFHLPCSTPLMLASAFCGREKLLRIYQEAISRGYRFFSYGDAMLFL
ncbi:MAG: tRNA preQ1(34) S-adenosylmethionine ribosyltransferase-isomerase QueA [Nitrospirae bacterium]|nr:MAG: tRNA preQ1(34) S-adenosylmethionine ribosyltransferase-isomerase QueA [Nitrospirota bacterium]